MEKNVNIVYYLIFRSLHHEIATPMDGSKLMFPPQYWPQIIQYTTTT